VVCLHYIRHEESFLKRLFESSDYSETLLMALSAFLTYTR